MKNDPTNKTDAQLEVEALVANRVNHYKDLEAIEKFINAPMPDGTAPPEGIRAARRQLIDDTKLHGARWAWWG
jgi:hypothetical protein